MNTTAQRDLHSRCRMSRARHSGRTAMCHVLASVLVLCLTGTASLAQAQNHDDNWIKILNSLQQVRTMMYLKAQRGESAMTGVRNIDRTIVMVQSKIEASRRAR